MTLKIWLIGALVAFFCALADALSVYVVANTFVWGKVIAFSIIKGIGGAALYLRQNPVEKIQTETRSVERTAVDGSSVKVEQSSSSVTGDKKP